MTKYSWKTKSHSLYFGIGPLNLFKLPFDVAWLTTPFPELTDDVASLPVTRELIPHGCQAAVIEAHPYSTLPLAIAVGSGLVRYASFRETRFLIDLRGDFAAYMKKFAPKPRHNILGEVRRFTTFSG